MYIYRGKLVIKEWTENEGITVIFPSEFRLGDPVYTCWQWKGSPEKNISAFYTGTIDELTVTSKDRRIGFYLGEEYSFSATFSDAIDKLSITMRSASGQVSDETVLDLVYKPNPDVSPDPTFPRIYLGKITNYRPYAVDETIIIVAPGSMDEGNPICAFWTWDHLHSGRRKVNEDVIATISNVEDVWKVGEKFQFRSGSDYYTFDVTVEEVERKLTLAITGDTGKTTGKFPLDLVDLYPPSTRGGDKSDNHTIRVYNDTNEIITCSLKASGTGLVDETLATASLTSGGVGLVAALDSGLPSAVGTYAAAVGWHVSVGGVTQVSNPSGEDTSAVLFPLDTVKHTSNSIAISNNDLHINLTRVDDSSRRLIISTATFGQLGAVTLKLSELLPEKAPPHVYKQLHAVNLPSKMRLMAYRNVIVPQLSIEDTSKAGDIRYMKENDVPNALSTFDKSTSTLNWYGTLDEYYNKSKPATSGKADAEAVADFTLYKLFKYSPNVGLSFSQGVGVFGGSHAKVVTIESNDGSRDLTLLKLANCAIGKYRSIRVLRNCLTEDEIAATIKENGSYWAYGYKGPNEPLVGYVPDESTAFYYGNDDVCVYFIAQSSNPIQSLVAI